MAERCETCIYRPGNKAHLVKGRLKQLVTQAIAADSATLCHHSEGGNSAVCRGFFELYPTPPLQLAVRLGLIENVPLEGGTNASEQF